MKTVFRLTTTLAIVACYAQFANAVTYYNNLATGTAEWRTAGTWQPAGFPNADADVASFQTSANVGAGTPLQTANRNVNVNDDINTPFAATVGRLDFNLDVSGNLSRNVINQGLGDGKLIFDGPGATNSQLNVTNVQGAGNLVGLNDINTPVQLNDQLQLTINSTSGRNDHLNLRMRGLVTGSGGITKLGPTNTLLIWPTPNTGGGLQYTGPTYLGDPGGVVGGTYGVGGGGRNQFVPTAPNGPSTPTLSSAFYVVGNAQLGMSNDGTFQFGAPTAVLHFNSDGTGNSGGEGALRPERTATRPTQVTITNTSVSLDGPLTVIHSEGSQSAGNGTNPSLGFIQFDGVISGGPSNRLQLTTTSHSQEKGTYVLAGTNTFSGGIDLYGGRLSTDFLTDGGVFNSATLTTHPNATFGTGDIHVRETPSNVALSMSRLTIPSGVLNAIADDAMLSIDGFNDINFRSAFAELGDGVNELVGSLVLGGVLQTAAGTYGSTSSLATFQFDEFFTGTGMITIPAPGQEGDHNEDGIVDAADYVIWRKSPGDNGGDPGGYNAFFENFGEGGGPGAGGSGGVPEPTTLVLLGLLAPFALAGRRSRK